MGNDLPAINTATPAEARATFNEWLAWEKTLPKDLKAPLPLWITHVMSRIGQLAEEKHPQRAIHEKEIVLEYAKLSTLWAEVMTKRAAARSA